MIGIPWYSVFRQSQVVPSAFDMMPITHVLKNVHTRIFNKWLAGFTCRVYIVYICLYIYIYVCLIHILCHVSQVNQLLRVRKKSRDSSALEETLRQDQPLRPLHQLSWRQLQLGCPVLVAPIAQLMPGPIAPTLRCGTTASLAPYGPSGARQSHSGDAPHVLRCADEAESREPKPSAGWLRSSIRCQVDADSCVLFGYGCSYRIHTQV